jgi:hypothetical protein
VFLWRVGGTRHKHSQGKGRRDKGQIIAISDARRYVSTLRSFCFDVKSAVQTGRPEQRELL